MLASKFQGYQNELENGKVRISNRTPPLSPYRLEKEKQTKQTYAPFLMYLGCTCVNYVESN